MRERARLSSDDQGWRENRHDHHQGRARTLTSAACRRSSAPTHRDYADPVQHTVFASWGGPVNALPAVNTVNAGAGVPLVFSLPGNQGLNILETGYPQS